MYCLAKQEQEDIVIALGSLLISDKGHLPQPASYPKLVLHISALAAGSSAAWLAGVSYADKA